MPISILLPALFWSRDPHLQPITGIFTKKKIRSGELFGLYLGARCSIPRWQQFLCDMKLDTVRKDVYGRTSYIFDIQDREGRITIIDAYYLKDSTFGASSIRRWLARDTFSKCSFSSN